MNLKARSALISTGIFLGLLMLAFLIRIPILNLAGRFLIAEDSMIKADAIFVLSGDPWDRGLEAVKLYNHKYAPEIICTGSNASHNLKAMDQNMTEADLTRYFLIKQLNDSSFIRSYPKGSSTFEEAYAIMEFCKENEIDTAIIVSSLFHTRRLKMYLQPVLEKAGIVTMIKGAAGSLYNESEWWKEEDGMIAVNNEYMKLFYYCIKY